MPARILGMSGILSLFRLKFALDASSVLLRAKTGVSYAYDEADGRYL